MDKSFFKNYYTILAKAIISIDSNLLIKTAGLIRSTSENKKKIILIGNGGSASIASHVAIDLTKAAGCRAITFNEPNLLTCFANDYGYENWVKNALDFYADKGDLAILISSSGSSLNIINGAGKARELGMSVITLSGFSNNNQLRKLGDINLYVESNSYNIVEMTHHIWLVSIVDYIVGKIE